MKMTDRIKKLLGLGVLRRQPAPHPLLIAPGLVVTDSQAVAWFVLGTENTEMLDDGERDALLDDAVASIPPIIEGRECHVKIVWGRENGDEYLASLDAPQPYDELRADYLDRTREIAKRFVVLGVVIDAERGSKMALATRRTAQDALSLPPGTVSRRELAWLHGQVRSLGDALRTTSWRIDLASSELLAWLHARELHHGVDVPASGALSGARLAPVTTGKIVPWPDHLEVVDEAGSTVEHVAVLVLADFPEQVVVPGMQEWLRTLSDVVRVDLDAGGNENERGVTVPVYPDASMRFRVLPVEQATKAIKSKRDLAKEQRQSAAKHSTGETSEEIEATEETLGQTLKSLSRDGLRLVEAHPRIIVREATAEALRASVQAVQTHYSRMGITAYLAVNEQQELWLEQLPGDQLRVDDLGHVMDATALLGSWWWGGSEVGMGAGHRMIGYQLGSTPGICRSSLIAGAARGDSTTTGFFGRSGRGKTTALMLMTLDAVLGNPGRTCALYLALKGDDLAISDVARLYGADSSVVSVGTEQSGIVDLFALFAPEEAILHLASTMQLLTPPSGNFPMLASTTVLRTIQEVSQTARPTTWEVISRLVALTDPDTRTLGHYYASLASTPLGAPLLGPPAGHEVLPARAGLWVVHFPGLKLPGSEKLQANWDASERVSIALARAFILHSLSVVGRMSSRGMAKLVVLPEVHRLLHTSDGIDFLDQVARMGRALNASLAFDLQDVTSVEAHEGLVEQLQQAFIFQLLSPAQQDAAARLCGWVPTDDTRTRFRMLGVGDEDEIRHGHAIHRDARLRVGEIQITYPDGDPNESLLSRPLGELLSTTPTQDGEEAA